MSLEAIESIKKAEVSAAAAIADSEAEAKRLIAEAESAGASRIEDSKAKAAEEAGGLMQAAKQNAIRATEELESSTANKRAALRAKAESRMDKAAMYIAERIVSS